MRVTDARRTSTAPAGPAARAPLARGAQAPGRGRWMLLAAWLAGAGCAVQGVEWANTQPARELARQTEPSGSVALGWRVYQQRCAACHGAAAEGSTAAPDLTRRLRALGPHAFVSLVLSRYDPLLGLGGAAPSDDHVSDIVARRKGTLTMPAWQGEPVVTAHVMDLYVFLRARSDGRLGTGRP